MKILLTGPPGSGKSTLIERIIQRLSRPASGFLTREIRREGRRLGFSIITLDGQVGVLAHQEIASPLRVGRYGINIDDLERIAVPSIQPQELGRLVVVDEIGKMECLSPRFRQALRSLLDSPADLLGSISQKGGQFIEGIKRRADVELIRLSPANRDELVSLAERFSRGWPG